MIVWGLEKKNQADWTAGKKSTPLFPKAKPIFWKLGKNKVCLIKMLAKQKSYLIIDIEKQKKISGVSDAQEKSYKLFKV